MEIGKKLSHQFAFRILSAVTDQKNRTTICSCTMATTIHSAKLPRTLRSAVKPFMTISGARKKILETYETKLHLLAEFTERNKLADEIQAYVKQQYPTDQRLNQLVSQLESAEEE